MRPSRSSDWTRTLPAVGLALVIGWLLMGQPLAGQSIIRGELEGGVRDATGRPVAGVSVTLSEARTGSAAWTETGRDGAFHFPRLPAGEYEVRVESPGFGPVLFRRVAVPTSGTVRLDARLEPAAPPVERVDTIVFTGGGQLRFDAAGGRRISRAETLAFPGPEALDGHRIGDPTMDEALGSEGLPGSTTRYFVDGIPFTPAAHPMQRGGGLPLPLLPRLGLERVELHRDADVEWAGAAGGHVSATTRSGSGEPRAEAFGEGTSDILLRVAPGLDVVGPARYTAWGGAAAHLPLRDRNSRVFVAMEGSRAMNRYHSPFSEGLAGRLLDSRPPAEGTSVGDLSRPWLDDLYGFSGLARLDWSFSESTAMMARASFATLDNRTGPYFVRPLEYGGNAPVGGTDLSAGGTLLMNVHPVASLELRGGFEHSVREWGVRTEDPSSPAVPTTRFIDPGALLGSEPGLAGRVSRTAVSGVSTVHLRWQDHRVKAGVSLAVPLHEYTHVHRSGGEFLFGAPELIPAGEGLFLGAGGTPARRRFLAPELGLFLQHLWAPLPRFEVTTGVRFDQDWLPASRVAPNASWAELTGIRNDGFPADLRKVSPRLGVRWDPAGDASTVVEAGASTHYDRIDPAALNEVLSLSGGVRQHRQVGGLDAWPDAPSGAGGTSSSAPVLALLGPELDAPRTARFTLGLSQKLGAGTFVHLAGTLRRTQTLLRRADVNLSLEPTAISADGRPIYGALRKAGSVVTVDPGSNRRFSDFDAVWALNSDGWSEYRGATLSVEHLASRWIDLFGSYTFSSTEDNLAGARAGLPEAGLDPRPGGEAGEEWREGTSDFDVPHRASAGFTVRVPVLAGAALSGVYRYRSGAPYTAGYRAGVDVNGDGSGHNDPAFVAEAGAELPACLRADVGGIARRNGCRAAAVQLVDLHVSFGLFRVGGSTAALTLDVFNILDAEMGMPDTALLLVDGEAALGQDPDTGRTIVPVQSNPAFGELPDALRPGRLMRAGFRVTLP